MRSGVAADNGSGVPEPFQNSVNLSTASITEPFQISSDTSLATQMKRE